MSATNNWVQRAERALAGEPAPGVDVVGPNRPPLLDGETLQAALSPLFAAIAWAGAVFRETITHSSLEPWTLLLRLLALALSVRALLMGLAAAGRLRTWRAAPRWRLALTDEGLLLRTPQTDIALPRKQVTAVTQRGQWSEQRAARRWSEVYLITSPASGHSYLTIPPVLGATPGVLAEALMRWRGVPERTEEVSYPEPTQLASALYDRVAAGERPDGVTVIRHGRGWLKRGPYLSLLLGLVVLEGAARLPSQVSAAIGPLPPLAVAALLGLAPVLWMVRTSRSIGPRKGTALVLTPAEMLMRTAAGVHRVPWSSLQAVRVEARRTWSLLEGYHNTRRLLILRRNAPQIRYDESFLGVPAEVAVALCEAYKSGSLP